ncbi:MAG: polyphenol oxidase family protein [Nannocystaceae bacterium]|nr:polyphenol oxidase family protein [Nannocystaceae bacterium]
MLERSAKLSAIPGLKHGFSDRLGGVSKGRFDSLNLGVKWGDDPEAVAENLRRVADAGGYPSQTLRRVNQVHRGDVLRATTLTDSSEADGLWCSREDGLTVAVSTADCVPILLANVAGTVAAAVHSGWRSTVAGIAGTAVVSLAVDPATLVAAIGPCIELARFEVGAEVAAQFDAAFVDSASYVKPHIDLVAVITEQLRVAGLRAENIERVGGCTHADAERYFSYRRDGPGIGQMMSFVGFA